jgi:hypothetical protein
VAAETPSVTAVMTIDRRCRARMRLLKTTPL